MTSTTLTLTRTIPIPIPGSDNDHEDQDVELEVEITGTRCRAEPDVGIMSDWHEDIQARYHNTITGRFEDIELSPKEEELAQEALADAAASDDYYGGYDG